MAAEADVFLIEAAVANARRWHVLHGFVAFLAQSALAPDSLWDAVIVVTPQGDFSVARAQAAVLGGSR